MQFVHSTGLAKQETKANRHLVRSHISKSNRRRTKALVNEALRQRKVAESLDHAAAGETAQPTHSPNTESKASSPMVDSDDDIDCGIIERHTCSTLHCFPPAMYLATLSAKSIIPDTPGHSNESANYFLKVIVKSSFLPAQSWFQLFCEQPLIYHAFSAVFSMQQMFLDNDTSPRYKHRMLEHRSRATRAINTELARVSKLMPCDLEAVILGIMALYPNDEEIERTSQRSKNFFNPHLPWADCLDMYAGGQPQAVRSAVAALVERAGGVTNLKLPGLSSALCRNDLILASISFTRPHFPCLWAPDNPALLLPGGFSNTTVWHTGIGFRRLSSHLHPKVRRIFHDTSCIDRLMADVSIKSPSSGELETLVMARDTVHHRLMSLPMAHDALDDSDAAIYECCRLTAILYSHCVIFPIQPGCAGVIQPIKQLSRIHTELEQQSATHSVEIEALRLWSLLICCIATLGTQRIEGFKATLGRALERYDSVKTLDHLLEIVRDFIWSDCAALRGAEIVWQDLFRSRIRVAQG